MSILVNSIKDLKGSWITEDIQILEVPTFDEERQAWIALANYYESLALIQLKVTRETVTTIITRDEAKWIS